MCWRRRRRKKKNGASKIFACVLDCVRCLLLDYAAEKNNINEKAREGTQIAGVLPASQPAGRPTTVTSGGDLARRSMSFGHRAQAAGAANRGRGEGKGNPALIHGSARTSSTFRLDLTLSWLDRKAKIAKKRTRHSAPVCHLRPLYTDRLVRDRSLQCFSTIWCLPTKMVQCHSNLVFCQTAGMISVKHIFHATEEIWHTSPRNKIFSV